MFRCHRESRQSRGRGDLTFIRHPERVEGFQQKQRLLRQKIPRNDITNSQNYFTCNTDFFSLSQVKHNVAVGKIAKRSVSIIFLQLVQKP